MIVKILGKLKEWLLSVIEMKRHPDCRFASGSTLVGKNELEGSNFFDKNSKVIQCKMGYASYVGHDSVLTKTLIGRYTCIGPNVRIVHGVHPTKTFASVHPAFFSLKKQSGFTYVEKQLFNEEVYVDSENEYFVKIGNDVWIGDSAKIIAGINIGDGAIIAAGAMVTKDVEPYSIVGGVPAQIIRYRFDRKKIEYLLKLKWWNKDQCWIRDHAPLFQNIDIMLEQLNDLDLL